MAEKEEPKLTPEQLALLRESMRLMSKKERSGLMGKAGFTKALHGAMEKVGFNFADPEPGSDFLVLHNDLCEIFRRRDLSPTDIVLGLMGALITDDDHFDWVMDEMTKPDPARFVGPLSDFVNGVLQVLTIFLLADAKRGVISHLALKRLMGEDS